jgi:hypothetical protein
MPRGIKKVISPPLQPPVKTRITYQPGQMESECGWLDPNGVLHPCEWSDHHSHASRYHLTKDEYEHAGDPFKDDASQTLEKKGWIKIQKCRPQEPDYLDIDGEWYVTCDQYNFLNDYMAHHGAKCMGYLNLRIK